MVRNCSFNVRRPMHLIAIRLLFFLSLCVARASAQTITESQAPAICSEAKLDCQQDAGLCQSWRTRLDTESVICPGVNAVAPAAPQVPPGTIATNGTETGDAAPERPEPIVPSQALEKLQAHCLASGMKTGASHQIQCLKQGFGSDSIFSTPDVTADIDLYRLKCDELANELSARKISSTAARVDLQRIFLDVRDRLEMNESRQRQDDVPPLSVAG